MRKALLVSTIVAVSVAAPLSATQLSIPPVERLHYSWSLRGALSWIARVAFPTRGTGTLETVTSGANVHSRLEITSPEQKGFAFYESRMSADGARTFTSADGYSWNKYVEEHRVTFDYARGIARVEKRDEEGLQKKVRKLGTSVPQDVLTSIFYLRQNASQIRTSRRADVYSGGKPYAFVFSPRPITTLRVGGEEVRVRPFTIVPIDGERKGSVRVWLTDDARRIPVQIEIAQTFATLRLDLKA